GKSSVKQRLALDKRVKTTGEEVLASASNGQPVAVPVEAGNVMWNNYKSGVISECPGAQSDQPYRHRRGYNGDSYMIKNSFGAPAQGRCRVYPPPTQRRRQRNVLRPPVAIPQVVADPTPTTTSQSPSTTTAPATTSSVRVTPLPTSCTPVSTERSCVDDASATPSDKCSNNRNAYVWPLTK
ncbi:hypothetical protein AaE_006062, partial [Aphanomyces astaci]